MNPFTKKCHVCKKWTKRTIEAWSTRDVSQRCLVWECLQCAVRPGEANPVLPPRQPEDPNADWIRHPETDLQQRMVDQFRELGCITTHDCLVMLRAWRNGDKNVRSPKPR